ncbi:MAG: DUF1343 domain-containing protein, partial [Spirochaetia bacterium]|nr:DUF1343 domain-containing protein [Spirochaetia bacterium]
MPLTHFQDPLSRFLSVRDEVLFNGKVGLLSNQISFHPETGEYLFQILERRGSLKRVFIPEHGLFGELQDQIPLTATEIYSGLIKNTECISLYGLKEESLVVQPELLSDLDALVVDIQDVGSRYYTFATTFSYILDILHENSIHLDIYIIDRINPAGRQIEGIPLDKKYSSFVGRTGLLHRHGMTIGELSLFYKNQIQGRFNIHIIRLSDPEKETMRTISNPSGSSAGISVVWQPWWISPSPNMPTEFTPLIYTGQCLLEGTNLNEGRGTTRPFEIFGAPYLKNVFSESKTLSRPGAILRPLKYIPSFHKHAESVCNGFQIHLTGQPYHSLLHTVEILRHFQENENDFEYLKGVYEYRSDLPAIELLAGDEEL